VTPDAIAAALAELVSAGRGREIAEALWRRCPEAASRESPLHLVTSALIRASDACLDPRVVDLRSALREISAADLGADPEASEALRRAIAATTFDQLIEFAEAAAERFAVSAPHSVHAPLQAVLRRSGALVSGHGSRGVHRLLRFIAVRGRLPTSGEPEYAALRNARAGRYLKFTERLDKIYPKWRVSRD
jgi:hypothetical protein